MVRTAAVAAAAVRANNSMAVAGDDSRCSSGCGAGDQLGDGCGDESRCRSRSSFDATSQLGSREDNESGCRREASALVTNFSAMHYRNRCTVGNRYIPLYGSTTYESLHFNTRVSGNRTMARTNGPRTSIRRQDRVPDTGYRTKNTVPDDWLLAYSRWKHHTYWLQYVELTPGLQYVKYKTEWDTEPYENSV